MVGLSIKSQGWRWAKIDCFDDQFEQKNTWIKESFAAVEDVGWRICRDVIIYICTSEDQTIISHAHGIVGKFRWLCPSAGWRSAMCLVRWSVAFSEWWDKTWKREASAVVVTCTMRPCNSNNGNLCEPYDFALHGEGSSLWAVEHLIFWRFQLNSWSLHPFLFAKSWVSVIGKGTPMLPWEAFLTSEVRPCLWCESCRGHVLHCSLRGHRRVGREAYWCQWRGYQSDR